LMSNLTFHMEQFTRGASILWSNIFYSTLLHQNFGSIFSKIFQTSRNTIVIFKQSTLEFWFLQENAAFV